MPPPLRTAAVLPLLSPTCHAGPHSVREGSAACLCAPVNSRASTISAKVRGQVLIGGAAGCTARVVVSGSFSGNAASFPPSGGTSGDCAGGCTRRQCSEERVQVKASAGLRQACPADYREGCDLRDVDLEPGARISRSIARRARVQPQEACGARPASGLSVMPAIGSAGPRLLRPAMARMRGVAVIQPGSPPGCRALS